MSFQPPVALVAVALAFLAAPFAWGAGAPPSSGSAASSGPLAHASEALQEVSVTAHRIDLQRRVSAFVAQIATQENEGEAGLARWKTPAVCPLVSGISKDEGEYILGRFTEIAQRSGVPVGGEQCHPNLYILVTSTPEALLQAMQKRNRRFTFGWDPPSRGDVPANVIEEFIRTPRAVRAWYNTAGMDGWGAPLQYCPTSGITCDGYVGAVSGCTPPPPPDPTAATLCGRASAGGTHLEFDTVWTFSRVFEIVDARRLQGVTRGQLADYVAMVGLAKLKPVAQLGDAPTILKLFEDAAQDAPAGLTEWDQAFLKGLYGSDQRSRLQKGEISRAMTRDINH